MFRFLRKYNKWILAVGGTLLLIVFLIPQAIQGLSQAAAVSNAPRATLVTADGSAIDVSDAELRVAQRDLEFMQRRGLGVRGLGQIDDPWHWYLLSREAEEAGLIGGRFSDFDPAQFGVPGFSIREMENTLGRVRGVNVLVQLYRTAGQLSDRRLRAAADDLFQGASVRTVIIEASPDTVDLEPTADAIRRQMDLYPDVLPGAGEETPFGYRLPDRVKIEWLEVPADSVRAMLEGSDELSGKELRKHWRRNAGIGDFPPVPEDPPATVPDVVRKDLLDQLTTEKLEEISRFAASQLRSRVHGLPREGAYMALPEDWADQRMALTDLAVALQQRFEIDLPSYQSSGDRWLSTEDLLDLPGIGEARTDRFPGRSTINLLVAAIREFQGSVDVLLQEGVAGPVLISDDGSLYFFRILATDPSRPPTSVDEVRDEVVADLRRIAHYEQLLEQLPAMNALAEAGGLLPVALEHDTIVQRTQAVFPYDQSTLQIQSLTGRPLVPTPSVLPVIGGDEKVIREIMDYVDTLPRGVPFSSLSESQRFFTVSAEHNMAVIVGELVQRMPFTEPLYRERVGQGAIQTVLLYGELSDSLAEVFGYEALAQRHQFKPLGDTATTQPGEEEGEQQTADSEQG